MRCGVLSARKATNAGCGMRLIITREPSWCRSLVVAKMRSFCSAKRCWSPSASPASIRIIGARTHGIWTLTFIARANGYTEDRAPASDVTDADQTLGPQDDPLLAIDADT
jgi:hypothetical protein